MIKLATISNLVVSLTANTQQFQKNMQAQQKRLQNLSKSIGNTGKTMTKWVTGPIAAVAGGIFAMGVKMGNTADEILDLASATGMSTEAIQEYRAVADRAGVSQDAVAKASEMLTKSMSRGAEGSADMRLAMEKLGLEMDTVRQMSPDERMETLITSLQGVEDAGERAELGNRLLRNGYKELAPILDMTQDEMQGVIDQAHETGRVMGDDALENADQFRQGLDELKGEFMGLFNTVMGDIMPMLTDDLLPAIKEHVIPLVQEFGERIGSLIEWFTGLNPETQKTIGIVVALAAAIGPVLIVLGKLIGIIGAVVGILSIKIIIIGAVVAAIAMLIGWLVQAARENEDFRAKVEAIWERIKKFGIEVWQVLKEVLGETWEALQETFRAVLERMQEFWDVWGETILEVAEIVWEQIKLTIETIINIVSDIIQLALAIIRGDWEGAWEAVLSILETTWAFIEETVENATEAMRSVIELAMETIAEFWEAIWTGLRDWFFELLESVKDKVGEIWNWIEEHIVTKVTNIYDQIKDRFGSAIDWATGAWEGFRETVADIWEGITNNIRGAVNVITGLVNSMIAGIEGGINFVISGVNDFISTINRRIRGLNRVPGVNIPTIGTLSSVEFGRIPEFAQGGIVPGPPDAPQLIMAHGGEEVLTREQRRQRGGGDTYHVNITGNHIASDYDVDRLMEKAVAKIRSKQGVRF